MSAKFILPFESPIAELETKLQELEAFSNEQDIDVSHEISRMKEKIEQTRDDIYAHLSAWQKVQVARQFRQDRRTQGDDPRLPERARHQEQC